MNNSRTLSAASLVSLLLVLAACGSEQQPAESSQGTDQPTDQLYGRELDKARGVEQTLQQQKDNIDRTLQEQERPSAE
jgi:Flp pilus assembly protein TadD